MMFYYIQNSKFLLILFFVQLYFRENIIMTFSLLNKNNKFDQIKSDFILNVEKNKILTIMKKNKIKVK